MDSDTPPRRRFGRQPIWMEEEAHVQGVVDAKRRLGLALHELAADLARERRRTAGLERENERLRALIEEREPVSGPRGEEATWRP